jgi:hypothetical protein
MRRSIENAEQVGLFRYFSWKKARRAPKTHVQHPQYLLPASSLRSNTTTTLDTNSHHPFHRYCLLFYVNEHNSKSIEHVLIHSSS